MKPQFTIDIEGISKEITDKAKALFKNEYTVAVTSQIRKYFSVERFPDPKDRSKLIHVKGPGVEMIDDWLDEKFIKDSENQARLQKYFDEHFDRIFEECMEKAIQHHCNALAFKLTAEKMEEKSSTKD